MNKNSSTAKATSPGKSSFALGAARETGLLQAFKLVIYRKRPVSDTQAVRAGLREDQTSAPPWP